MTVLVTGATSLIGAGVATALARRGDDVVCLQRRAVADELAAVDGVRVVLGDIRHRDVVRRAASGCSGIVHVAAKVGVVGAWEDYRSVNVDGTANVIAAARELDIGRVVHVSSPSVAHGGEPLVGAPAGAPVLGRRRAYYAESKALAELVALDAAGDRLGVVAVRPHLVWGPGDTQLVGRIVDRARAGRLALIGDGAALVDTTYIDNAVDALVAALDRIEPGARCSGRAYVVANGEPRTIRELVEGIVRAAGIDFAPRSVPLAVGRAVGTLVERAWSIARRSDEPPITSFLAEQLGTAHWFDPRPARDELGWTPAVSLDEGFTRLAAWFADGASDAAPAPI